MRPLIINDSIVAKIKAVVEYAYRNPYSMDDLLDIKNGQMKMAGDDDGFSCNIPGGYRMVFSIENQPMGKVRHLSISVNIKDKLPTSMICQKLMNIIGFEHKLTKCIIQIEDCGDSHLAINILEIIT